MAGGEKRRALTLLTIIICICSAFVGWNQMRYSKKDLFPADFMKIETLRIEEVGKKITISDPPKSRQVFINFRGEQLRHNFISHLTNAFKNRGIKFFIDTDMLPGKELKNLFVMIEESRIALAILSESYTTSKWCMNELVKFKRRSDEGKLYVIPILYKVKASDVKNPTRESEFGNNFCNLTKDSQNDPVEEWKEALEWISNKSALTLTEKSSEAEFIKKIVNAVEKVN